MRFICQARLFNVFFDLNLMKRFAFYILISLFSLSSCSIKENRENVPCNLVVDYSNADPDYHHIRTILSTKHGNIHVSFDTLTIADHVPNGFEILSPKGFGKLSSITGFEQVYYKGDSLCTRSGRSFDKIFAFKSETDCRWDTGREYVEFSKQHCVMTIKSKTPVAGYYPYNMRVRSTSVGMNIYTFEPVLGDFSAFASKNRDGTLEIILPRQYDDSMMLDIVDPNGKTEMSFKVGMMIKAAGYNWNSEKLDDITVTIDYASMTISVEVENWTERDEGTIII